MSVPKDVHDLFDFYLQSLAFEIGELEHRCTYFRNIDENVKRSPEQLYKLYNSDESAGDEDKKATEGSYYRYPEVHSEIRMALAHISRAVIGVRKLDDASFREIMASASGEDRASLEGLVDKCCCTEEEKESPAAVDKAKRQVSGAKKHLLRALMDARKGQYEVTEHAVSATFDYCLRYGIHGLDSGNLIKSVREKMRDGQAAYEKAKLAETLGYHDVASLFYDDALESIDAAGANLGFQAPNFRSVQREYLESRKRRVARVVLKGLFGWWVSIKGYIGG